MAEFVYPAEANTTAKKITYAQGRVAYLNQMYDAYKNKTDAASKSAANGYKAKRDLWAAEVTRLQALGSAPVETWSTTPKAGCQFDATAPATGYHWEYSSLNCTRKQVANAVVNPPVTATPGILGMTVKIGSYQVPVVLLAGGALAAWFVLSD